MRFPTRASTSQRLSSRACPRTRRNTRSAPLQQPAVQSSCAASNSTSFLRRRAHATPRAIPVGVTRPLRNLMSTDVGWAPARALNRAHEAFDRLSAQHSGRSRQCARSSNAPAARRPSSTLSVRCLLRRRPHSLSTPMSSVRRKPVRLLTDGPLTVGIGAARTNRALWRICELGGCWTCPDPIQPSLSPMLCSRECLVPKGSAIYKLKRHRAAGYEDHLTRQSAMFLPSGLGCSPKACRCCHTLQSCGLCPRHHPPGVNGAVVAPCSRFRAFCVMITSTLAHARRLCSTM